MAPNEFAALREAIERTHDAVADLRGDVRGYAATQQEHARRLCDLEQARHAATARVSAAEADTGRFSVTAEMRIAACQKLEEERIASLQKLDNERHLALDTKLAALAESQRYWSRWSLSTAAGLVVSVIVAAVAMVLRIVGG